MAGRITTTDAFRGEWPKYFNQNIDSLQKKLQNYVKLMGERLRQRNNIPEYTYDLLNAGTGQVFIYGRIYARFQEDDPDETLTDKNAEIQLHPDFQDIQCLKLDYKDKVNIPGLFKGQIIAAQGIFDTDVFHATQIFTDCRTSPPSPLSDDFKTRIIAVNGPYVKESFEECQKLNEAIRSYDPEIVIFMGPFARKDCKLLHCENCEWTAVDLTTRVISILGETIENPIFIPAIDDCLAIPTIPRPPLQINTPHILLGDPVFITIQHEMRIMATANDLQRMIAKQYNGAGNTRRKEIPRQIALQASACPVMDPAVQYQYLSSLIPDGDSPHLMITSTVFFDLNEDVDGTKVVLVRHNPGAVLTFTVIDVNGNHYSIEVKNGFNQQ